MGHSHSTGTDNSHFAEQVEETSLLDGQRHGALITAV